MNSAKPGVVFNCNVLLQAIISNRGPAWRCYQLAEEERIILYVSAHVLDELRRLPGRLNVKRLRSLTSERVDRFIRELLAKSEFVAQVPALFTYARDTDDARYVDLASAAGANFIVTRDRDLLTLMNSATREGSEFHKRFPNLRIVNPVQFLAEVAPFESEPNETGG